MSVTGKFLISLVLLSAVVWPARAVSDSRISWGLSFRSHTFNPEDRTSLDLNKDGRFSFRDRMSMEFDICFKEQDLSYGYVFRVVSGDASVDMISNIRADRVSIVCIDDRHSVGNTDFDDEIHLEADRWYHIRFSVSKTFSAKGEVRGGINCSIDGVSRNIPVNILDLHDIRILFGKNEDPEFFTTDVPPVTIRDIKIFDGSRLVCHWPLSRHNGEESYDIESARKAVAKNAVWKMDSHYAWHKVLSLHSSSLPMVAYDVETSRIFVAGSDSLYIADLDGENGMTAVRTKGSPVRDAVNQMVYDRVNDRLLSYSMHSGEMAVYDFTTATWSGTFAETWPPLTGHGKYYDADSCRLYLFGGYGNHRYYAAMTEIDTDTGTRTVTDLSASAFPRYFGSFCVDSSGNFIVMGGFGSKSGLQEESPVFLNDIFRIDRKTGKVTELGRFRHGSDPVLFSSSMVFDDRDDRLFALAFNSMRFNTTLDLVSASSEADTLRHYSEPIEFKFHDIDSFSELVFSQDSSYLYAIVNNARQNGKSSLEVWSLAYPPVSREDILQPLPKLKIGAALWIIVAMAVLAAAVSALVVFWKMRPASEVEAAGSGPETHPADPGMKMQYTDLESKTQSTDSKREKPATPGKTVLKNISGASRSALPSVEDGLSGESGEFTISMLGEFKVRDRAGNEITSRFTSKLRSLFIWMLLRTRGVPENTFHTDEINDVFWFKMDRATASNNRNVNFKRLRQIFSEIGDIRIRSERDVLMFLIGNDVTCDYVEAVTLLESLRDSQTIDLDRLDKALDLCARGSLLPGFEYAWLDRYKAAYSELVIAAMMKVSGDSRVSSDDARLMRIAECILHEDPLDEFAVRLKCRILYAKGHIGLSRDIYDKWRVAYSHAIGTQPQLSFDDAIK